MHVFVDENDNGEFDSGELAATNGSVYAAGDNDISIDSPILPVLNRVPTMSMRTRTSR